MSTNKGSYENPYTYDEYELLLLNDEWEGGFVRFPDGIKYSTGTDSGSDSGSDYYGSDELGSDTTNIETPGQPGDSTNTNPGRGGGGGTGGVNSGGGIPSGGGSSHSGGDEYPDIPDVLPTSDFRGLKEDDGCFKRCNEMLNLAGYELVPDISYEILMANSDSLGNATTAASSFEEGLDYIDDQLKQGIPVIVGVSYDKGKSVGDAWKDKAADHFVIIVGARERNKHR